MSDNPSFKQLSDNITFDVEALLDYINANLAGTEVEIYYISEDECNVSDFFSSDNLKINIEFIKNYDGVNADGVYSLGISLYRISSPYDDYELAIYLQEHDRLYDKIPPKLIHGCKKCLETGDTVTIII